MVIELLKVDSEPDSCEETGNAQHNFDRYNTKGKKTLVKQDTNRSILLKRILDA
jgi:hypothetical protein